MCLSGPEPGPKTAQGDILCKAGIAGLTCLSIIFNYQDCLLMWALSLCIGWTERWSIWLLAGGTYMALPLPRLDWTLLSQIRLQLWLQAVDKWTPNTFTALFKPFYALVNQWIPPIGDRGKFSNRVLKITLAYQPVFLHARLATSHKLLLIIHYHFHQS